MASNSELLKYLDLSPDVEDEDINLALTALVTSAALDEAPTQTLSDIYKNVVSYSGKDHLDPLHIVPLLLPSSDISAGDILALIGECGSPKEVILTVQEEIERLHRALEYDDDVDDEEPPSGKKKATLGSQLVTLLDLYASAIPRMKLRRKSATETIQSFIEETEATLKAAAPQCTHDESLSLIAGVSHLSNKIYLWCKEIPSSDDKELQRCKSMVKTLLDRTLIAFSDSIQSLVAQRTLEKYFPRQTVPFSSRYSWKKGDDVVSEVLISYEQMSYTPTKTGPFSTSDLFFFAHQTLEHFQLYECLPLLMPVIISALKTDTFVDEVLAVLLKVFHEQQNQTTKQVIPPDISAGLCTVLPSIASAHPDPLVRNQVFRCLSLVLSASDPHNRFQQLKELSSDPHYPQMRVASVGLVKEALLRSVSDPNQGDKYFLKPLFLPAFGPILFRPNPPDLLASDLSLEDFTQSPESARLVECLSLYYILIHRDVQNVTGIRDPDVRQTIDTNLLSPMRKAIERWSAQTSGSSQGHTHDISPIVSLQISLERIEKAHAELY